MTDEGLERSSAGFRTTRWTLVAALGGEDAGLRDEAERVLLSRYWPPAYAFLRRTGRSGEEAAELTQGFFVEVVLGRRLFSRADRERGRLRTLLIAALKHYLQDRHRRDVARRRADHVDLGAIDEEEAFLARQPTASADEIYEQRWATALLEETLGRCEAYFLEIGKRAHWEAFRTAVVLPALHGNAAPALRAVAAEFGFESPTHVASALKVVRKRLQILLREVTAETANHPDDQDAEYRRVLALLS